MPIPMAREKGQGTLVRLDNGRYRVAVTMPDGHRVWRRARTPREAERIRRDLVEARELDLDPSRQTLSAFLRSWLDGLRDARNARVRPRTLDHYTLIVERHIIPGLDPKGVRTSPDGPPPKGSVLIGRVTARKIQAWIDSDPAAPRTVRHHHAVLRRALNIAVRQRLLTVNPALAVELPDADADVAAPLTLDETRRLLAVTRTDRLHALWRLAVTTGLRQGELLGLARDDVSGDQVTVRGQLQRLTPEQGGDADGWAITETKAARRLDTIAIDADTAAIIDEHKRRQAAERRPDWPYWGLLFVTSKGRPLHQSEVLKAFWLACDRAGIPRRRFHDLRHTNASELADLGVAEDVRQSRHGHATKRMARRYAHASETQDRAAAEALGQALRGVG